MPVFGVLYQKCAIDILRLSASAMLLASQNQSVPVKCYKILKLIMHQHASGSMSKKDAQSDRSARRDGPIDNPLAEGELAKIAQGS